jgi:pimeloyl-ACP methyl ester carboxylesterase
MRKWLDQIKIPATEKSYSSMEQFAALIQYRYPRFSPEIAQFVARIWGAEDEQGRVRQAADPRHHWTNPIIYKRDDAEAIWGELTAPMLMMLGEESEYLPRLGADGTREALRNTFPGVEIQSIPDTGHMLHIERPDIVAPLVEAFLEAH